MELLHRKRKLIQSWQVTRAKAFYIREGYTIEVPPELSHVWDFIACGARDNIFVQVATTKERMCSVEEVYIDYPKAHPEIVIYKSDCPGVVPANRIIYPNRSLPK